MKFKKRFLLLVFSALLLESCFNPSKTENVRKENSLEEKGNQVRGSYSTTIQDSVKKMSKPKKSELNKPNPVTKVTLDWSVDAGNYFRGKIDDKYPITMFIDFEAEGVNPPDAIVYARIPVISGWYYYDKIKTKIPLKGIYHSDNQGGFEMYVVDSDFLEIFDSEFSVIPELVSETFTFSDKKVSWTHNGQTKTVSGINLKQRKIKEFVGLVTTQKDGSIKKIDLQEFLEQDASVTIEALQGLDGWAETDFSVSYSPVVDGTNVLLKISQSGSCNTDRTLLVSIKLDESLNIANQSYYKIGDCRNFSSVLDNGAYIVVSNEGFSERASDIRDTTFDLGSYKIVNSDVVVIKGWDFD